jgi:hypothetical protein
MCWLNQVHLRCSNCKNTYDSSKHEVELCAPVKDGKPCTMGIKKGEVNRMGECDVYKRIRELREKKAHEIAEALEELEELKI